MSKPLRTESVEDKLINDTLVQKLTPSIPPYAKDWTQFDETISELATYIKDHQSNPYFRIFAELHIMARVAMHNRHIGRYEIALALYQHLIEYARSKQMTPNAVPRYYILHTSNLTVLYRDWASMVSSDTETRALRHKAINQGKLMQRYFQIEKRKNASSNQLLQIAYAQYYDDSKWNIHIHTAKMHSEIAHNMHRLCDRDRLKPDPQTIRQCEYHFNKALKIHTTNDFGVDTHYFFEMYVNWIYEVRNDLRTNKKLIHKVLIKNLEIANREFGELSLESISCYRGLARYYGDYLSKNDVAIEYFMKALPLLRKCIDAKTVDGIELDDQHPLWVGRLKDTVEFYKQVVASADMALRVDPSNQTDLKQQILNYKKDAKKTMKTIRKYSAFE
eukprot:789204_1